MYDLTDMADRPVLNVARPRLECSASPRLASFRASYAPRPPAAVEGFRRVKLDDFHKILVVDADNVYCCDAERRDCAHFARRSRHGLAMSLAHP
ncbi:hypothetical protein DCS_04910 [Drechmeria coniospora]|uniref:Uncharacterized protein n=1 Tax=Drechmeria coniospora TaxID=98403 RepID=A0A151GLB5_DRECN|nr:hypothetical protein DCS_04910 [Drechmeria coniospora]KYK57897.1 hypothetical protein DCS_04910 [Drechmeria coniospora]